LNFVSSGVQSILEADQNHKLKVITTGLKLFEVEESEQEKCKYRVNNEGVHCLVPHMANRVISITVEDMQTLLTTKDPLFSMFSPKAREELEKIEYGSCVFVLLAESTLTSYAGWRGKRSCHLLVQKTSIASIKQLLNKEQIVLP